MQTSVTAQTTSAIERKRYCRACQRSLPVDQFHRHRGRVSGHHEVCRGCRSGLRSARRCQRRRADERWALLRLVRDIRQGKLRHSAELLLPSLLNYYGGAEGLGAAIANELLATSRDGGKRIELLLAVLQMALVVHQDATIESVRRDEEIRQMSNEELERQIALAMHDYRRSKRHYSRPDPSPADKTEARRRPT